VAGDGVEVKVVMPWHGVSITRAELVSPDVAIRLLPDISLPVDVPDIPAPNLDLDLEVPGWLQAILGSRAIWLPVILGVVIALREWRRRRPTGTHRDRGGDVSQGGPPQRPDQQSGQGPVS
jgi:hypothetical protein